MTLGTIRLKTVYNVPRRMDDEGSVWSKLLSDMHFANSMAGWVVGAGQILSTKDGGRSWLNQYYNQIDETGLSPDRVFAVTPEIGWVTAISSGTHIRCSYTYDGGLTWKAKDPVAGFHPMGLFFADLMHGWMVSSDGSLPSSSNKILSTKDGGESWEVFNVGTPGNPCDIQFANRRKGWLLLDSFDPNKSDITSTLLVSNDGGQAWQICKMFDREVRCLSVIDDTRLFVAGESGFIAQSTDGGANWRRLRTGIRSSVETIAFYDQRLGIAVGSGSFILLSEDAGETWVNIGNGNLEGYDGASHVHFVSASSGMFVTSTSIFLFEIS